MTPSPPEQDPLESADSAGERVSVEPRPSASSQGEVPGARTAVSGRAVSVLSIYLAVLFGIPASLRVAALGTVGAPAMLIAMIAFIWWSWHHLQRTRPPQTSHAEPIRRAALGFLLVMLLVYAHGISQPLPADEISPADSGLLQVIGMMGIVLATQDGITSIDEWRTLLRRIVLAGGLMAILGLLQFATKRTFIDAVSIPGLTASTVDAQISTRGSLGRPSGTATHPIEFAAIIGMILPLAINQARRMTECRIQAGISVIALGLTALLTVSRTAIVCVAIGLICLLPTWTRATRWRAMLAALALTGVASLLVPGLNGTIRGMFLGASEDSSVQSRTASWGVVGHFLDFSPLLGRGYGTFLPKYWILDNLYLSFLIQAGLLGTCALAVLLCTAAVTARRAARAFANDADVDMAQALVGSIMAGSTAFLFFDGFSFPQSAGCLCLLIGLSGVGWRLARARSEAIA